jgi:hypothetical protein
MFMQRALFLHPLTTITQMRYTIIATILFAAILSQTACQKSSGTFNPGATGSNVALRNALVRLGSPVQTFSVDAAIGATITGAQGTRLSFPPNSFKNAAGATITGNVQISLLEIYKPGDMIAHAASTAMGNGALLTTGGQILVNATQNGQVVQSSGYDLSFLQPRADSNAMSLFLGGRNGLDSVVSWSERFDSSNTIVDSLNRAYYRFTGMVHFEWINCDRFANTPGPKTKVRAYFPSQEFGYANTFFWMILPDINAATNLGKYVSNPTYFESYDGFELPVGMRYKMVAVSFRNDTWYYSSKKA